MKYDFDEIIDRSNTLSVKWDHVGESAGNPAALPMWIADMDFRSPQPVIDAVKRRAEMGIYGYPYLPPEFNEVTREWVMRRHGWDIAEESVIFSAGIIPAMYNVVQAFTDVSQRVLIQRPVYYPFTNAIVENKRAVSNSPLVLQDGKYRIDFDSLEAQASEPDVSMMFLCNPHNPAGRVYTSEELRRIGEICLRHGLLIFSDEIHSDFIYPGHKHVPIASISPEIADITITALAPSKTFNLAGLRSACLIIPNGELRHTMQRQMDINRAAMISSFGVDAYIAAYKHGDEYLGQLIDYLQGNVDFLSAFLSEGMPKIKLVEPQGTYLMWLDFRELGLSNEELDDLIINKSAVALDKGHWFGDEGSGFMRMNIACPRPVLRQALNQIQAQYKERRG